MIRTFEEYTSEMSSDEKEFIMPALIKILAVSIGRKNAVTNMEIINSINYLLKDDSIKTCGPRIRHMIHVLRVSHTIPFLVASSKGYHISNDTEEIETYIGSIDDRLRSIYALRRALKHQVKHYDYQTNPVQGIIIF